MDILMRNLASGTRHWFDESVVERSVPCNGGPEGWLCVALMPQDWPDDEGEFSGGANVWLLLQES